MLCMLLLYEGMMNTHLFATNALVRFVLFVYSFYWMKDSLNSIVFYHFQKFHTHDFIQSHMDSYKVP